MHATVALRHGRRVARPNYKEVIYLPTPFIQRFASEVPGFGFQVPGSGSVDSRPPLRLLLTVTRFQVPVPSPGVEPGQGLTTPTFVVATTPRSTDSTSVPNLLSGCPMQKPHRGANLIDGTSSWRFLGTLRVG